MISVLEDIVAGGFGGALGVFIGVPLDTVKVRMQSMPLIFKGTLQTLRDTIRLEGVGALYRGCMSPIIAQIGINALTFSSESAAMRLLGNGEGHPTHLNSFLAGSFGGFVQCFALVPTDLIKCKLQVDGANSKRLYSGILDCIKQTIATEGFRGLYRGMAVTSLREVPSYGVYFAAFRMVKQKLTPKDSIEAPVYATLIAGGCAGCLTWFSIYPIDVIKSVIQTAPLSTPKSQLTMSYVAMKLFKTNGIMFFYRGYGVTVLRAFPVNACTFYFYETFKKWLGYLH